MAEKDQESKRVEDWLTRGRPLAIRTRGAVRTRGAPAPTYKVEVKGVEEVPKLLQQLNEEVPEVPWVVVVDGKVETFAEEVCLQAKQIRGSSKFWLIGSKREIPEGSALATLTRLQLNPQYSDELQFIENLIADLVIVPREPEFSQDERVRRWLSQARYILAEDLEETLIEELRMPELAGRSKAQIFIIKD
jgi:hypothetical protein